MYDVGVFEKMCAVTRRKKRKKVVGLSSLLAMIMLMFLSDANAMHIGIGKNPGMYLAGKEIEIHIDHYRVSTLDAEVCAIIEIPEGATYLWVRMPGPVDSPLWESGRIVLNDQQADAHYLWTFTAGYDWAHWSLDNTSKSEFESRFPPGSCEVANAHVPDGPLEWKPSLLDASEEILRGWGEEQ